MKKRKNFLILWDFDGTLVGTMKAHLKLAGEVITKYFGIDRKKAKREYLKTTGLPFEKQLEIIFPGKKYKKKREECAKEYSERKIREVYRNFSPIKGALEVLKSLRKKGYKQFILSGTDEKIVKNWLRQNKISGILVFGKEEGTKKDHIEILRKKFPKEKFLLVSDSFKDLLLPVEVKVGFYKNKKEKEWLSKAKPDFLINNLKTLRQLLSSA